MIYECYRLKGDDIMRRMQTLIIMCFTVCMMLLIAPLQVRAEGETVETYGDYEYKINDDGQTATITKYIGDEFIPKIPDTIIEDVVEQKKYRVTAIGESAFKDCHIICEANIPDSVLTIEDYAFSMCDELETVSLPSNLQVIGDRVFDGCLDLSKLIIPEHVNSIGCGIVSGCTNLVSIEVDSNNKIYDSSDGCNAIIQTEESVLISGYKKTKIPDNIKKIGAFAFENCKELKNIYLPDSVVEIGSGAFVSCSSLETVRLSKNLISVGMSAFYGCGFEEISIPIGCKQIAPFSFMECYNLKKIIIPKSVELISSSAFKCFNYESGYLKDVTIYCQQDSVASTYAKKYGFKYKIYSPSVSRANIIGIPTQALYTGKSIIFSDFNVILDDYTLVIDKDYKVTYSNNKGVGTAVISIEGLGNYIGKITKTFTIKPMDISLKSSQVTVSGLPSSEIYSGKPYTYPKTVVKASGNTLTLNKDYKLTYTGNTNVGIAKVTITGIGNYTGKVTRTFAIRIPVGRVYTAGNLTYKVTKSQTNGTGTVVLMGTTNKKTTKTFTVLNVADSVVIGGVRFRIDGIYDGAFRSYPYLKKVVIGANVRSIGNNTFYGCTALTSLTIGKNVRIIGQKAFSRCKKLASVVVNSTYLTTTSMRSGAFSGIYSKAVIKVPVSKLSAYKNLFRLRGVAKTARIIKNKR